MGGGILIKTAAGLILGIVFVLLSGCAVFASSKEVPATTSVDSIQVLDSTDTTELENAITTDAQKQSYIENSTYYNEKFGFSIDLTEGEADGYSYQINESPQDGSDMLICYGKDGKELFSVYVSDLGKEFYDIYQENKSAAELGTWFQEMTDSMMDEYGEDRDAFVVERMEDILLDGRDVIKLRIRTKESLLTLDSVYVRYFVSDAKNETVLELSRQFNTKLEMEDAVIAYEQFVETLKWLNVDC